VPRVEINGRVVEFAQMPTPEDIDHVASTFGAPAQQGPLPSGVNMTGSSAAPTQAEPPPSVGQQLRGQAPMIGQVAGGLAGAALAPETGGLSLAIPAALGMLGGIGGSAIQRGGAPTLGDVGTAAAGEALPFLPGAARMARGAAGKLLAPEATRLAERFNIPLSAPEGVKGVFAERVMPWLASSPLGAKRVGRAGVEQAAAVGQAATKVGERFGGDLPPLDFGAKAKRAIVQTVKRLSPGKGEKFLEAAKKIAGDTLDKAALAEVVAKDPVRLAKVMRTVGDQGMNDLRASWWTSVLESATGKQGLRKGVVSPKAIVDAWDGLAGKNASADAIIKAQTALFGQRRQFMADFVETLRSTQAADLVGSRPHVPLRWSFEIPAAVGGMLMGHGVRPYAMGVVAVEGALPWMAAHALVNGPPGAVGKLLSTVGPAAARAGVQALAGGDESTPAAAAPQTMMPPPAAPGLDSPEGIMAAIMGTRLPPGWRPGQPPVMR
jgi:hypothetical protein